MYAGKCTYSFIHLVLASNCLVIDSCVFVCERWSGIICQPVNLCPALSIVAPSTWMYDHLFRPWGVARACFPSASPTSVARLGQRCWPGPSVGRTLSSGAPRHRLWTPSQPATPTPESQVQQSLHGRTGIFPILSLSDTYDDELTAPSSLTI